MVGWIVEPGNPIAPRPVLGLAQVRRTRGHRTVVDAIDIRDVT
jgi:hypothetical protein